WLLAIPHFLVVAVFTSTAWSWWGRPDYGAADYGRGVGLSLLGVLVLIVAFMLLFTGRYQSTLFDLIMGVNRWTFRVAAYVALMRDEYPPFRLDQGAHEPGDVEPDRSATTPALVRTPA
ncbi:MAG TPA: DUF4389 domain-containing protein, partial [Propionibacteriaceae bacterium]|nr:DUF4389 domain-containing protein [Propionibacteriaceae bacterium]